MFGFSGGVPGKCDGLRRKRFTNRRYPECTRGISTLNIGYLRFVRRLFPRPQAQAHIPEHYNTKADQKPHMTTEQGLKHSAKSDFSPVNRTWCLYSESGFIDAGTRNAIAPPGKQHPMRPSNRHGPNRRSLTRHRIKATTAQPIPSTVSPTKKGLSRCFRGRPLQGRICDLA